METKLKIKGRNAGTRRESRPCESLLGVTKGGGKNQKKRRSLLTGEIFSKMKKMGNNRKGLGKKRK